MPKFTCRVTGRQARPASNPPMTRSRDQQLPDQRRSRSRPVLCIVALGGVLAFTACSITQPVRLPSQSTLFAGGQATATLAADSLPAGEATAKASDAALLAAARALVDKADRECGSNEAAAPQCFAGGLGLAMDALDARRIELVGLAAQVSNGNATYNALLYPAGGVAVFEKLRGATNRNLLLPAVAAASLYGFMNSGVVDRERHYLRAAGELHCAILRSASWLYPQSQIVAPARATGRPDTDVQALQSVLDALRTAQSTFAQKRVKLQGELKPVAAVGPVDKDSVSNRLDAAAGRGRAGSAGSDSRQDIHQRTRRQLETAHAVLEELRALRARIAESGLRLRVQFTALEQDFQRQLSERVGQPASPDKVGKEISALASAMVTLQAGSSRLARASPEELDPVFPPALEKGISAQSRPKLQEFAEDHGVALASARENAQAWLDAHALRLARVDAEVRYMACEERLPPVPVRTSAATAAAAAAKPSTDVTAPAAGSGTATANSPTVTPLPPAAVKQ